MADYPFKINECHCHAALFLWQLQRFMDMGCLSNIVAMATVTRLFFFQKKITANLIDKICYYASHMNESSLNDSKNFRFLTL